MGAAAAPQLRAIVNACKADHRGGDVAVAAWIEQWRAGGAAGAPIFGDAVIRRDAEFLVELAVVELAKRFLVQDRNLAPLVRIVEPIGIDVFKFPSIERRPPRLRQCRLLAPGLNALNLGPRFGQIGEWRE